MADRGELPAGYRRCKYLCGNGKESSESYAYIDTGICDRVSVKYDIVMEIGCSVDFDRFAGVNKNRMGLWTMRNFQTSSFVIRLNTVVIGRFIPPSSKFVYSVNGGSVSVDGISVAKNTQSYNTQYTIWLFGVNVGDRGTDAKIYGAKMWENGELVRNFVPSIDSAYRPCMYDTVSKQAFYSEGKGELGYELINGDYVPPIKI